RSKGSGQSECLSPDFLYRLRTKHKQLDPVSDPFWDVLPSCFNDCRSQCGLCALALLGTAAGCGAVGPFSLAACIGAAMSSLGPAVPTVCVYCARNCL